MKDDFTLLTFALDQVWYAINVHEVQEVVPLPELTPLTDAPPFIRGIFKLRGRIVTTLDLRLRMGLRHHTWDLKNAVLVIPFQQKLYGLIVDEALSLIKLSTQDMEPTVDLSSFMGMQSQFIFRVGKLEGRLIPILDLNPIFTIVDPQKLSDWQVKENQG